MSYDDDGVLCFLGDCRTPRCRAHSQGDRCRKELFHADRDPVHEGQFTRWQDNKFREEKVESK